MSKVIDNDENRSCSSYVGTEDGKYYWVDSGASVSNGGYQLTVFPVNANFEVTDWREVYAEQYSTYSKMVDRHKIVCENLEKYLSGDAEYDEWHVDNENEEDKDKDSVEMTEILQKLDLLIEKFEQLQRLVVESEDEA